MTRPLIACTAALIAVLAAPLPAAAQCSCAETANPSFPRTRLTAYAGEFEALVAAETLTLGGQNGAQLRAIARAFRKTELLVRKAQVLQVGGKFAQAEQRYDSALGTLDKLALLIGEAAAAGQLASEPGDRLDERHSALSIEVGRLAGHLGAETCYGQCAEVCGEDGACYGLAYRCQCMWHACYPTCAVIG